MQHLLAFTKTVGAASTDEDVPGIVDGYAPLSSNSHYLLPRDYYVQWAYLLGATMTKARLNMPSLRAPSFPRLNPLEIGASVLDDPAVIIYRDHGPKLAKLDEMALETSNSGAGEVHFGLFGITDQRLNTSPGPVTTIRATAAITTGNKTWGAGQLTLEQGLQAGRYAVIGMDVIGANLIAARLIFPEGGPRPGVLGRTNQNLNPHPIFRMGRLGELGQFEHTAIPTLEAIGSAALTTQEVYLDVVRLG